jgi:hypothetical protein
MVQEQEAKEVSKKISTAKRKVMKIATFDNRQQPFDPKNLPNKLKDKKLRKGKIKTQKYTIKLRL